MPDCKARKTRALTSVIVGGSPDECAYDLEMATDRTSTVRCPADKKRTKEKIETSCDLSLVAKLMKKLHNLQVYNELNCYEKLRSEEEETRVHISLWRSVKPQGRVPIMRRIFGSTACKKMDSFVALGERKAEIRKSDVKGRSSSLTQNVRGVAAKRVDVTSGTLS